MSASLYWRPTPPKDGHGLSVGAPSAFMEAMKLAFGRGFPMILERSDSRTLRAMAAVREKDQWSTKENPYEELAEAVEQHEAVEVWAEW